MPNGKPGDHPLTDIVVHELDVYSAEADALVREIYRLSDEAGRKALGDRLYFEFNVFSNPDVPRLERALIELRHTLTEGERASGRTD